MFIQRNTKNEPIKMAKNSGNIITIIPKSVSIIPKYFMYLY